MKSPRLLIAGVGLLMVAGTAACTTHAGAAAQVGDATIDTSTVRGMVDRGISASTALPTAQAGQSLDRTELQRRTLTTLVQLDLIEAQADRLGITVSPQDVDAYYQAYGVLQFGSVQAFEQRAAAAGFARQDVRTIVLSGAIESKIEDRIAPGLVASDAQARSQYDSIVSQVGAVPLSYAEAKPYLVRFLVADSRSAKLRPMLISTSHQEKVSVSPRFGVWSDDDLAVVAANGSIATVPVPVPTVALSQQS